MDIGLINYKTALDWVKKYDTEGEQSIQDTYPRKNYLNENEIIQSISQKGNCLDNSPTENLLGRLKEEIWYNKKYESSVELIKEIHNYIKYYNETRIVTRLKTTPIDFRKKCLSELGVA